MMEERKKNRQKHLLQNKFSIFFVFLLLLLTNFQRFVFDFYFIFGLSGSLDICFNSSLFVFIRNSFFSFCFLIYLCFVIKFQDSLFFHSFRRFFQFCVQNAVLIFTVNKYGRRVFNLDSRL